MINLLSQEMKRDIRASRQNVTLLNYLFVTVATVLFVGAAYSYFYIQLKTNDAAALELIKTNNEKSSALSDIRKASEEYKTNLSIASQIIDNSKEYTPIIIEITKLMPKGVVLDSLTLNKDTLGGQQTDFSAHATSYKTALDLKTAFEKSSLFSNVYFNTLENEGDSANSEYPVAISMSAKVNTTGQKNDAK